MDPMVAPTMTIGEKGRVVIPAAIRDAHGWEPGTKLMAVDTEDGLLVMSLDEALEWLRSRLAGRDVLQELFDERERERERERQEYGR